MRRSALLFLALVLTGCGVPPTRRFIATVTESATIDCSAQPRVYPFFEETLLSTARAAEKAWKMNHQFQPPTPQGRFLDETESDGHARAFFESYGIGSDSLGGSIALGPNEVYLGDVQENYIDLIYETKTDMNAFNPGPEEGGDTPAMPPQCPPLVTVHAELLATTIDSSIDGRVRRSEISYLGLGKSSCDAVLTCTRNILVSGVEQ